MDAFDNPAEVMSLASLCLVLLLDTHHALLVSMTAALEEDMNVHDDALLQFQDTSVLDMNVVSRAALHHFRLSNTLSAVEEDLGFWVKPRSTAWFSSFLLQEYDDIRWVQLFRMSKHSVFSLAHLLAPTIKKKDTKYRFAIPVVVRVACSLFKLCQGCSLLICSELFAVGRSTVSTMLRQVVHAVNDVLRAEICWPTGDVVTATAAAFKEQCRLPGVMGAIDGTHFAISKPKVGAADYFYFKSGAYAISCQAVVDSSKCFLDLYVGMPGLTNDSRMLRRSTLYHRGQRKVLWDAANSFYGFAPFLVGNAGYPLLPWLMVPHRLQGFLSLADQLFNQRLSRGRAIVENTFALLKLSFKELHQKSDLDVTFFPDVVTCCALLHNVLLKKSHEEVEMLLDVLQTEGLGNGANEVNSAMDGATDPQPEDIGEAEGELKRRELGVFMSLQRIVPF